MPHRTFFMNRRGFLAATGGVSAFAIVRPTLAASRPTKLIMQAATSAPGIGQTDFYVASHAGFLKDEGLDVEVRYATGASQAAQLVASGSADFGRFAFDPVIHGYDKGLKLRSFYEFYRKLIYYVAVPEDSSIRTIADLKGKTFGVTNMGSNAVGVFKSMLRHAGMSPDAATLLPVGFANAGLAALKAGRIDGFMYWNEVYAGLLGSGMKLRFIKHPTLENVGSNGYFAAESTIKEKSKALAGFARSIAKACVFIHANYDAAAKIYLQVNPAAGSYKDPEAIKRYAGELKFWSADWIVPKGHSYGENSVSNLEKYIQDLKTDGAIKVAPPASAIVTNELIKAANDFDHAKVEELAMKWK